MVEVEWSIDGTLWLVTKIDDTTGYEVKFTLNIDEVAVSTTLGAEVGWIVGEPLVFVMGSTDGLCGINKEELLRFRFAYDEERFGTTVVTVVWFNFIFNDVVWFSITCDELSLAGIEVGTNGDEDTFREDALKDGDTIMPDVVLGFSLDAVGISWPFGELVRLGVTLGIEKVLELRVSDDDGLGTKSLDVTVFEIDMLARFVICTMVNDVCCEKIASVIFGVELMVNFWLAFITAVNCIEGCTIVGVGVTVTDGSLDNFDKIPLIPGVVKLLLLSTIVFKIVWLGVENVADWAVNVTINLTLSEFWSLNVTVLEENWLVFTGVAARNDLLGVFVTDGVASSWPHRRAIYKKYTIPYLQCPGLRNGLLWGPMVSILTNYRFPCQLYLTVNVIQT